MEYQWNTASARVYVEWNTAWVYLCLYLRTVLRKNGGHVVVDVLFYLHEKISVKQIYLRPVDMYRHRRLLLCPSPSKFNIVPMVTDRLTGRLALEPILSVKWSVTMHTM